MKSFYELVLVVDGNINYSNVIVLLDEFFCFIVESNGILIKYEYCGIFRFLYPIKKKKYGHYIVITLKILPLCLRDLGQRIYFNDAVLRSLIIKIKNYDYYISGLFKFISSINYINFV